MIGKLMKIGNFRKNHTSIKYIPLDLGKYLKCRYLYVEIQIRPHFGPKSLVFSEELP